MYKVGRDDVKLLFEHYNYVEFVPNRRYRFSNHIIGYDFKDGFRTEKAFRDTMRVTKPFFIANHVPLSEELLFDIDYKLSKFDDNTFEEVVRQCSIIDDIIREMYSVKKARYIFSGRGVHLRYRVDILEEIEKEIVDFPLIFMKLPYVSLMELTLNYVQNRLETLGEEELVSKLDRTVVNVNKLMRTPGSINDKSFLPVVEFNLKDGLSLDYILTYYTEPSEYRIVFRKPQMVRVYADYEIKRQAIIDGYEALRQLLFNNYNIKNIIEV